MSKLSIKKRVQLLLNDFNYCAMTVKSISIRFNKQFVYVFTKDIFVWIHVLFIRNYYGEDIWRSLSYDFRDDLD